VTNYLIFVDFQEPVKCQKCSRQTSQEFCDSCFADILEKRVRKEIRVNNLLSKGDRILVIDDGSAESKLATIILPRLLKELPVRIRILKMKHVLGKVWKGHDDRVIIPWNADMETSYVLECIATGKEPRWLGNYHIGKQIFIKLFMPCLQSEVERLARLHDLEFRRRGKGTVNFFLDTLESEYPEVKFSIMKSTRALMQNNFK
jgi:hypothetical protein